MLNLPLYKAPKGVFLVRARDMYNTKSNTLELDFKIYKFISLWKPNDMGFTIPNVKDLISLYITTINGDTVFINIHAKTKVTTYILNIDKKVLNVLYVFDKVYEYKKQKFLTRLDTPLHKANIDYDDNEKVISIKKDIVIDAFIDKQMAYPSQCFIDDNDNSCLVLSVYFNKTIEKTRYDIMHIKNGKIGMDYKITLPIITNKKINTDIVLRGVTHLGVDLDNSSIFQYIDDEIVYPAAISI